MSNIKQWMQILEQNFKEKTIRYKILKIRQIIYLSNKFI